MCFLVVFANLLKIKNWNLSFRKNIQTLYSALKSLQTLLTWIWVVFPHSSWQILSSSIRFGSAFVNCQVQLSPQIFYVVQVWALAGPLKDIKKLVQKPLQHCLGCMHCGVKVRTSTPVWGLVNSGSRTSLWLDLFILSLYSDQSPHSCRWELPT